MQFCKSGYFTTKSCNVELKKSRRCKKIGILQQNVAFTEDFSLRTKSCDQICDFTKTFCDHRTQSCSHTKFAILRKKVIIF